MKKIAVIVAAFFVFSIPLTAEISEDSIISRTGSIYDDFYMMASAGLIKSAEPESFRYSPMTGYDAAKYIVEAANNLYAYKGDDKSSYREKLLKYYKIYRKKAFEIYNKTMEMREEIKKVEKILETPQVEELREVVEEAGSTMIDIEKEFQKTTFRGVPPFKVMGMLNARWQDVEAFGVAPVHHTSLGGTFMQLWTEGVVNDDISFKLNLTFEKPADEAEKGDLPEYWGTGQRFLDKYTINLNAYGWTISTGFFWEDITPFVAKAILSERPALFDRDVYALEETTKGHYENAFLHAFVARGDIWSKHGFMGVRVRNLNLKLMDGLKNRTKIMAGKAEEFDERYDKLYLYEYALRTSFLFDLPVMTGNEFSLNFFNTSNEQSEIETLAPDTPTDNYPKKPEGYIQSATIFGGDFKTDIADFLKLKGEVEIADTYSYLPKLFDQYEDFMPPKYHQKGNAMYIEGKLDELPFVDLNLKYSRIDPDYVARASAIIDTANRVSWPAGTEYGAVKINYDSYAGDPTLYYNNLSRIDVLSSIEIPGSMGFININYGMASQIKKTTKRVYVDHFLFGNRLTGAMWWHLFYSQYGYPVEERDVGFYRYNAEDHPIGGTAEGRRYIFTEDWLENKELIMLGGGPDEASRKNVVNASIELKFLLNKMLGMKNNLFLELYGELVTLSGDSIAVPTFDPNTLFSQNLMSTFIVYNLTRRVNIMAVGSVERWTTNKSVKLTDPDEKRPIDYVDTSLGFGLDYDFAPRTSLFLRAKRFTHEDMVYPSQNFNGWHLYAEIKNFF